MNRILILVVLALSACKLALPTPEDFCTATPATQAWLVKALNATAEGLAAGCEIVGKL